MSEPQGWEFQPPGWEIPSGASREAPAFPVCGAGIRRRCFKLEMWRIRGVLSAWGCSSFHMGMGRGLCVRLFHLSQRKMQWDSPLVAKGAGFNSLPAPGSRVQRMELESMGEKLLGREALMMGRARNPRTQQGCGSTGIAAELQCAEGEEKGKEEKREEEGKGGEEENEEEERKGGGRRRRGRGKGGWRWKMSGTGKWGGRKTGREQFR